MNFAGLFDVEFVEDPQMRSIAIEEFNIMMRCTLTLIRSSWGVNHVRFIRWCERIEEACKTAKEQLTEEEYADFSSQLLDSRGYCRKRRAS